jgi:hypothetical protein
MLPVFEVKKGNTEKTSPSHESLHKWDIGGEAAGIFRR